MILRRLRVGYCTKFIVPIEGNEVNNLANFFFYSNFFHQRIVAYSIAYMGKILFLPRYVNYSFQAFK